MTSHEYHRKRIDIELDINMYGEEVNNASMNEDYRLLNIYHSKREVAKEELKQLKLKYPEYVL